MECHAAAATMDELAQTIENAAANVNGELFDDSYEIGMAAGPAEIKCDITEHLVFQVVKLWQRNRRPMRCQ